MDREGTLIEHELLTRHNFSGKLWIFFSPRSWSLCIQNKGHQNSQSTCCGNVSFVGLWNLYLMLTFARNKSSPLGHLGSWDVNCQGPAWQKGWNQRASRGSMWISKQGQREPHPRHPWWICKRTHRASQVTFPLALGFQKAPCEFSAQEMAGVMSPSPKAFQQPSILDIQLALKNSEQPPVFSVAFQMSCLSKK